MEFKILTSTQKEYEKMLKIAKENDIPSIDVYPPRDSFASVVWSVDDIKGILPEVKTEEELMIALSHISSSIRDNMTVSGWDTIDVLKSDMLDAIENSFPSKNS